MITMNFQRFSKDELVPVILQKNLRQPFNSTLQQEIINTKRKNRKKQEQEIHVNKKWKEENKMLQKGFEAHRMAKPKETQSPMKETKV